MPPPKKKPTPSPTPEQETPRKSRFAKATAVRADKVDRRIAARLTEKGWKVTMPDGEPYVPTGTEFEAGKRYEWDKY